MPVRAVNLATARALPFPRSVTCQARSAVPHLARSPGVRTHCAGHQQGRTYQLHEATDDPPLHKHVPLHRQVRERKKKQKVTNCARCPMISPASQQQSGAAICTARRRHSNYEFHNKCLLISTDRSRRSQSEMYETQVQVKQRYTNTGFSSSVAATEANTNTPIIDQALLFHVSRGCSGWSGGDGGGRQRFRHSSPVITLSPGVR